MFTFNSDTNHKVRDALSCLYDNNQRVRIVYGNPKTGIDWLEENEVMGTIGKSTGVNKVPLLIYNTNSSGGLAILTQCILKIVCTKTKRVIYQADNYKPPVLAGAYDAENKMYAVTNDGVIHARFETQQKAINYINFMQCKRMTK